MLLSILFCIFLLPWRTFNITLRSTKTFKFPLNFKHHLFKILTNLWTLANSKSVDFDANGHTDEKLRVCCIIIPALQPINHVTYINFSELPFPLLQKKDNNSTCFIILLWELRYLTWDNVVRIEIRREVNELFLSIYALWFENMFPLCVCIVWSASLNRPNPIIRTSLFF